MPNVNKELITQNSILSRKNHAKKWLWNKDVFQQTKSEKTGFQQEFIRQKEKVPRKKQGTAGKNEEFQKGK